MNNNAITDFPSSSRQEIFESFRPQITVTAAGDSVVGPSGTTHEINRRKKRRKMCRFAANVIDSPPSQQQHKSTWKKPEPCTECGKQFSSWKALFGHMRCHPERPWRGINPPSNSHRRSFLSSPPDQSASEDLGLGFPENFTEEDLEVATCLVLLSTAISMDSSPPSIAAVVVDRVSNADVDDGMAVVAGPSSSSGLNNNCLRFECSSCKRVFGSHQALGGHRASHKNVKGCFAIARSDGEDEYCQNSDHHGYGHGHGHGLGHGGEDKQLEMVLGHRGSTCMRVLSSGGGQRRSQYWEKGLHEGEPLNPSLKREEGFGLDLNLPAAVAAAPLEKDGESSSSSSGLVLDLRLGI